MISIKSKADCCGCSACKNICPKNCIEMVEDNEGFLYPEIDKNICINCRLCEKVCPIINDNNKQISPKVYACKNINDKIRIESSSGGIFSIFSNYVVNNNGIVFGAMFDNEFNVVHEFIHENRDLNKLRGSKYVQSDIGNSYKLAENFLKEDKKVLFSGTPCQIAGLKIYLRKEYPNLRTIDIICHGTPSPKVFRRYKDFLKLKYKSGFKKISFRDKQYGWSNYNIKFEFLNSKQLCEKYFDNMYIKGFLQNLYLRPSCYDCKFKNFKSGSDITLADYWGISTKYPKFDDDKGVSLVFINTLNGQEIFKNVSSKMEILPSDLEHAVKFNPCIRRSVYPNPKRSKFFEEIDNKNIKSLINKYTKQSIVLKIKNKVVRSISKIKK